jgi:hypothetical protein
LWAGSSSIRRVCSRALVGSMSSPSFQSGIPKIPRKSLA